MGRFRKHIEYPFKYPGIIPRALSNYWQMLVLRRKRLRAIEFSLNWDCQCNCEHCSASRFKQSKSFDAHQELSTAQVIEVIRQAQKLGAMNINLTGGECLLRGDIPEIVRASRPKSTVMSVATNGILLTKEKTSMLSDCGVRIVTISLDSADPEIHDRIRGYPGCFEKVITGSKYAMEDGIEIFLCTILTHENIESGDIYRMVRLSQDLGVTLTINLPCGVGSWSEDNVLLTASELEVHRNLLKEPNVRWEGLSNYRRPGCPAGIEKLYISPSGDVMPCPFIHIGFGNLKQERLDQVWNRMLTDSPFNRVHDRCLVAEDHDVMESYRKPLEEAEHYPLHYSSHASFPADRAGDDHQEEEG